MNNRFGSAPFRVDCTKGKSIVILAPHPDDEVLGCGRLIAAAPASGIATAVIVSTDGHTGLGLSKAWSVRAYRSQVSDFSADDPGSFTFDARTLRHMLAARECVRLDGPILTADGRKTAKAHFV
jgi:GlcNAc-PI de-N-acetylase